jgi:hypothetical protein
LSCFPLQGRGAILRNLIHPRERRRVAAEELARVC